MGFRRPTAMRLPRRACLARLILYTIAFMEASPGRKPRNPGLRSAAAIAAGSPLREIVTEEIRQAILSGRYKPGQRLIEDRLAADFEVSRNPVREALRSLAAEGLVALTARRGAAVAAPAAE